MTIPVWMERWLQQEDEELLGASVEDSRDDLRAFAAALDAALTGDYETSRAAIQRVLDAQRHVLHVRLMIATVTELHQQAMRGVVSRTSAPFFAVRTRPTDE